jgi:multiple sugar transport system substrate-binding protein
VGDVLTGHVDRVDLRTIPYCGPPEPGRPEGVAMRRSRWIVTLLAVTALVVGACTSDEGAIPEGEGDGEPQGTEPVVLDLWVFKEIESGAFYDSLIVEFEAANPNIDIEMTSYPEENYGVKLETAIAAGRAPDLLLAFGPEDIRSRLLLPIDDVLAEHGVDLSTYSQSILGEGGEFSCGWEGQLYCIGSYQGVWGLVYNKSMLDAAGIPHPAVWPPMTPDEFVDAACRLTDPDNQVWGAAAADPMYFLPWEIYVSDDARTVEGRVNGPDTVHQFDVLAQGFDRGCLPSLNVVNPEIQGRDFMASGSLAMVITDLLDLRTVEEAGIDYGVSAPPTPTGYEPYFFSWSDTLGVPSTSDNPDEAMEFVAFVATEGGRIRFQTTGDLPLDSVVAEEMDWAQGIPGRLDILELASHARPSIFFPNRWDVLGPLWDAWGFLVSGEKTAQQALDDAAPAIQENLDQAWEVWEEQSSR